LLAKNTPKSIDYFLIVLLGAIFGSSFLFTRISVQDVAPITVATARILIALIIMFPIMRLSGHNLPAPGRIWGYIYLAGITGNALPFALVSWGQVKVDSGLAAIFMAIMPLTTILLAHLFTDDEKINRWKLVSVTIGIFGIVVLMGPNSLTELGDQTLRQLAILGAALCYACNAIVTRKLTSLPKSSMVTALMFSGCTLLVPICIVIDKPWMNTSVPTSTWLAIAMLAIMSTIVATYLVLLVVGRCGASFLSQINFLIPLFGVLFGSVFLQERLPGNAYIALAIIILALALSRVGQGNKT